LREIADAVGGFAPGDGEADGAVEQGRGEARPDQVIGRPGFDRPPLGLRRFGAGQQDDRHSAAGFPRLAQQIDPGAAVEPVVEQQQVVARLADRLDGGAVAFGPVEPVFGMKGRAEQAGDAVAIGCVVTGQKHAQAWRSTGSAGPVSASRSVPTDSLSVALVEAIVIPVLLFVQTAILAAQPRGPASFLDLRRPLPAYRHPIRGRFKIGLTSPAQAPPFAALRRSGNRGSYGAGRARRKGGPNCAGSAARAHRNCGGGPP
jgi:hypothetical protein